MGQSSVLWYFLTSQTKKYSHFSKGEIDLQKWVFLCENISELRLIYSWEENEKQIDEFSVKYMLQK